MPFDFSKIDFTKIGITGIDAIAILCVCYTAIKFFQQTSSGNQIISSITDIKTKDVTIIYHLKRVWIFAFLFIFFLLPSVVLISFRYVHASYKDKSVEKSSLTVEADSNSILSKSRGQSADSSETNQKAEDTPKTNKKGGESARD